MVVVAYMCAHTRVDEYWHVSTCKIRILILVIPKDSAFILNKSHFDDAYITELSGSKWCRQTDRWTNGF